MNKMMIELMGFDPSANVAVANARAVTLRSDADKMRSLADVMRKDIKARCESYKAHVTATFLDCDADKVKVSKRVARVPKYARSITK